MTFEQCYGDEPPYENYAAYHRYRDRKTVWIKAQLDAREEQAATIATLEADLRAAGLVLLAHKIWQDEENTPLREGRLPSWEMAMMLRNAFNETESVLARPGVVRVMEGT